jgi:hypothetical protein
MFESLGDLKKREVSIINQLDRLESNKRNPLDNITAIEALNYEMAVLRNNILFFESRKMYTSQFR